MTTCTPLPSERVEVAGQGGDQRLAFAGLHFGDLALVQHHAADQLHVEVAHVEEAAAGFADHGEGFDQEVVERGALGDFLLEFDGFGGQVDVGELAKLRLEFIDGRHRGQHGFDFALVFGAKDFGQKGINHVEDPNTIFGVLFAYPKKSFKSARISGPL